ncbi:hypothetical protein CVV68_16495 [Arthrobacter livingstonensis]|uniref:Response regulatory domain-containing protein n=1 Tax=Arthrobacter livingstonensis TaxID=670078 RepID=A0A2V5LUZ2_9MICC|nr:response regulator [Arthrobacter livingstonensis]PYI65826.1 hypothetical protein CVV68_16495 [Arthrobacter livingstonensis]
MTSARTAVIIEDDQDIRELLTIILGQSGYEVHAAETGMAGVDAVRLHRPALVTVDVGLPDMDGFEVTERIRPLCQSHIIMLTARSGEMDTVTGLEAGADEYLTKPFRAHELRARVEALAAREVPEDA